MSPVGITRASCIDVMPSPTGRSQTRPSRTAVIAATIDGKRTAPMTLSLAHASTVATMDTMETESSQRSPWPLVVTILGLAALGLAGFIFQSTRSLPGDVIDSGRSLIESFKTGTVTTRFISYASEMSGSNYLQFANLKQVEVFERTDSATVMWGQFALPDVVVRAEAPVDYTYYLDLDDRWELLIEDGAVIVHAPAIRYNPPAIDVSNLRYEIADRSVLRDEERALENLRRGLSDFAKMRALQNIPLVRELGRKKTEEFIRNWLLASYDDAESYRIDVLFPGETDPARLETSAPR